MVAIWIFPAAEKARKNISKSKMSKKSPTQDESKFEDKINVWRNKENVNIEKAALVIQNRKSDFMLNICNITSSRIL